MNESGDTSMKKDDVKDRIRVIARVMKKQLNNKERVELKDGMLVFRRLHKLSCAEYKQI